jgi:hypothetical protein
MIQIELNRLSIARSQRALVLCTVCLTWLLQPDCFGDIVITQRTSSAEVNGFAGAGGAGQSYNNSNVNTGLSGNFSFSDSYNLAVTEGMPFSTGASTSVGSLSVSDNLVQENSKAFHFTGARTASGLASHGSGNGVATGALNQEMRVRFQVVGQMAKYHLTGLYDPGSTFGIVGETSLVQLNRPFTAFSAFSFSSTGPVNLSGSLNPGFTYEFRLRLSDRLAAGSTNPFNTDNSSFNLLFSVNSIPEPNCGIIVGIAITCVLTRRRRPRAVDKW